MVMFAWLAVHLLSRAFPSHALSCVHFQFAWLNGSELDSVYASL